MSRFGFGFLNASTPPVGNDSFTKILLHFDGANGSTTFVDSAAGLSGTSWTATQQAAQSTTTQMFGAASLYSSTNSFSVSGGIQTSANYSSFYPVSNNLTVDTWINLKGNTFTTNSPSSVIMNVGSAFSFAVAHNNASIPSMLTASVNFINGSTQVAITVSSSSVSISNTNWQHVAFVKSGSTLLLFLNGVIIGSGSLAFPIGWGVGPSTVLLATSGLGVSGASDFYMDEFRYSLGIARWTANFTPPLFPYGP